MNKKKAYFYQLGVPFLVVIVAIGLSYLIMAFSDSWFKSRIGELKIIPKDDYLYTNYVKDEEDIYMYWETDAGSLVLDESETFDNKNSLGYYLYSDTTDKIKWNPKDNDGNIYEKATIRAYIYKKTENKDTYNLENVFKEMLITVEIKDGKLLATDERFFGNPLREGKENNWNQIYVFDISDDGITSFRYRSGEKVNTNISSVLCWEAEKAILSETDLFAGSSKGYGILNSNSNKTLLKPIDDRPVNTMSIKNLEEGKPIKIQAYLINYESIGKESFEEKEKYHKAELVLE